MRIKIASVAPARGGLRIAFAHNFHGTPEGRRALRILYSHVHSGYGADRTSITLGYATDCEAINTVAACQREMDKLANVPIQIKFQQPRVSASRQRDLFTNMKQLRAAQAAGNTGWVSMRMWANLPVVHQDVTALEKFVPGGVYTVQDDVYALAISVYLQGEYEKTNPWKLMNELKPRIREAIV